MRNCHDLNFMIEKPFFDNTQVDSGGPYEKNKLYDDGLPENRWRFPHQCAHWFGMTRSDDAFVIPPNSNVTLF